MKHWEAMQHDANAGSSAIKDLVVYKEDVHVWPRTPHDENDIFVSGGCSLGVVGVGALWTWSSPVVGRRWSFQRSSMPMNTNVSSVLARLARAVPTATRRMFGCTGVYSDGVFFAIVDDERLFFKVNNVTRPMYEGMSAFEPNGRTSKNYYEVPDHVVDDPETLQEWAIQSIEAARKP